MLRLSGNATPDAFFLAPTIVHAHEPPAIEEVHLVRDEMANMAWAVERNVESAAGRSLHRPELYHERRERQPLPVVPVSLAPASADVTYHLASPVPDYFIPLLPQPGNSAIRRLVRGGLLSPANGGMPVQPLGAILQPSSGLNLFDEEVPRAGATVTRAYQFTRWSDGSAHLWIGREKHAGAGPTSSGLQFDVLDPMPTAAGIAPRRQSLQLAALQPAEWTEFKQPTQPPATRRPYTLRVVRETADFPSQLRVEPGVQQLRLALTGSVPGALPVELTFRPRGSQLGYGLTLDLTASPTVLWPSLDLPLETLRPYGTWTLRVRNEADPSRYPAVLGSATGGGRATWSHVGKFAPTNVAHASRGSTASASSSYNLDMPPDAVINGDHRGASWPVAWADNTYAGYPDWVQVVFPGPRTLREIDVYTTQDDALRGLPAVEPTPTMTFQVWGLIDFDVQYWTGSTWQTIPGGHVVGNNLVWRKFPLPSPITTDRVRVQCLKGGFGYSRVVEVEAFDQSGVNIALHANGGVATASSIFETWPPSGVIDGDRVVYHWVGQQPFEFPGWLRVDFNAARTIDEVDV